MNTIHETFLLVYFHQLTLSMFCSPHPGKGLTNWKILARSEPLTIQLNDLKGHCVIIWWKMYANICKKHFQKYFGTYFLAKDSNLEAKSNVLLYSQVRLKYCKGFPPKVGLQNLWRMSKIILRLLNWDRKRYDLLIHLIHLRFIQQFIPWDVKPAGLNQKANHFKICTNC